MKKVLQPRGPYKDDDKQTLATIAAEKDVGTKFSNN